MGFWSTIGKGLGIAAAPFTGGASLAAIPAIDAISKGMGNASQAQASNRGTKAELMLDQNSALERELLAREAEKRQAQGTAYQNAVRADYANNFKPAARPEGIPNISFGPGLSQAGKGASSELFNQAMTRLQAPDLSRGQTGMPAYKDLSTNKDFKKTLTPGIWERILGYGSALSPIVGGLYGGRSNGLPGFTNKPQ